MRSGATRTRPTIPMSVAALAEIAPFPWRRLLASADLGGLDRVVVVENTAIPKIAAVYARTPVDTLKAWHAFHLADAAAPYLSQAVRRRPLRLPQQRPCAASRSSRSAGSGRSRGRRPPWGRRSAGSMWRAIFPPEAKAQIDDLVARHADSRCKGRIERLAWMSAANQAQGPGQARAAQRQDRLSRQVARLFGPGGTAATISSAMCRRGRRFEWLRAGQPAELSRSTATNGT